MKGPCPLSYKPKYNHDDILPQKSVCGNHDWQAGQTGERRLGLFTLHPGEEEEDYHVFGITFTIIIKFLSCISNSSFYGNIFVVQGQCFLMIHLINSRNVKLFKKVILLCVKSSPVKLFFRVKAHQCLSPLDGKQTLQAKHSRMNTLSNNSLLVYWQTFWK